MGSAGERLPVEGRKWGATSGGGPEVRGRDIRLRAGGHAATSGVGRKLGRECLFIGIAGGKRGSGIGVHHCGFPRKRDPGGNSDREK